MIKLNLKKIVIGVVGLAFLGNCFMSYRNYQIAVEADRMARDNSQALIQHAQYINVGIKTGYFPNVDLLDQKLKGLTQ